MFDIDIALEALCALCDTTVTSTQRNFQPGSAALQGARAAAVAEQLIIKRFISRVLDADETSEVSRQNFLRISRLQGAHLAGGSCSWNPVPTGTGKGCIIDEKEFFAPEFDYDFTRLSDTETYWRGGEKYERPCGWFRFGLKVLDKYDGNTWLGRRYRSTQSVPGEWPVSYHGTSKQGAEGIIKGHYEAGPRQRFGRGIYSTPDISVADSYAKTFTCKKDKKTYKVVLQNRINPKYREKFNNDKYWLIAIPKGTSEKDEEDIVEKAIRPYGLLLKEVRP